MYARETTVAKPTTKQQLHADVDKFCEIREQIKALKRGEELLRDRILPHCEEGRPLVTKNWVLTYARSTSERLDTNLVKDEMGVEWYRDHCKTVEIETLKGTSCKVA